MLCHRYVVEAILKKNKKANIKPYMVKNHLRVFVNARINNPTFDSQVSEPHVSDTCFGPETMTTHTHEASTAIHSVC